MSDRAEQAKAPDIAHAHTVAARYRKRAATLTATASTGAEQLQAANEGVLADMLDALAAALSASEAELETALFERDAAIQIKDGERAAKEASEAEVTRLETGITEALTILTDTSNWLPGNEGTISRIKATLSQPTTDTLRIDLLLSKNPEELTPDELTEVGRALGAIDPPTTDTNGAHA